MRTSALICNEAKTVIAALSDPYFLNIYTLPVWMQKTRRVVFNLDGSDMNLVFTYRRLTGDLLCLRGGSDVSRLLLIGRQIIANTPELYSDVMKLGVIEPELTDDFIAEMLAPMREHLVRAITGVHDGTR